MPAADDSAAGRHRRVDVRIKVNLKYPDRETFVARFSQNLSRTGIFIRASDPAPVGSRIHFEYRLQDESRILRGSGIVRWARRPGDAANQGEEPPGMGLEFIDLDPQSDQLIHEIVARHGEGSRAPQRKKAPTAPTPDFTGPALSLDQASLDPEEEDALDALLGGADLALETPAREPAAPSELEVESDGDGIEVSDEPEVELEAEIDIGADVNIDTPEVEPQAEIDIEAGVDVQLEAEVDVELEAEVELEAADVGVEPEIDMSLLGPEAALVDEADAEVELEADDEFEVELEPEIDVSLLGPEAALVDEGARDLEFEAEDELEVELEPEIDMSLLGPEAALVDEAEVEVELEAEVEVELEAETDIEFEAEAEPGLEVDTEAAADGAEVEINAELDAEIDTEAEVEPEPDAEPARPRPAPPRVPAESVLAEFDDIDHEDEAPRRTPSGNQALRKLAAADESVLADFDDNFAEPSSDTANDWVLDLSGTVLVSAPLSGEPQTAEIKLAEVDGQLVATADGTPVRNLIGWAGRPWPSAYAVAAARRNGITLSDTEEQVVMTLGDITVPVWDAVDALIDQGTAAFADSPPATVHVIVPSSTSEAVRDMLHDRLAALGVTTVRLVPDALVLLAGVGTQLEAGHWGLIANIGASETRVVLVRGPDQVITTHAAPDLGLAETDRAMTERCATQFLREHELDVEDDPSLRDNLRQQVAELRQSGAPAWDITIAGAAIHVSTETLDQWTLPWRERIAITCEALLSTHGGELAAPSAVVLATEEPAWPRLADTLSDLLGAETLIAEPGHAGRRRGIG